MAEQEKEKKAPAPEPLPPTVEELAEALKVPAWALAGLRVRMGWAVGQRVTREAFEQALREFLNGPTAKEGS